MFVPYGPEEGWDVVTELISHGWRGYHGGRGGAGRPLDNAIVARREAVASATPRELSLIFGSLKTDCAYDCAM